MGVIARALHLDLDREVAIKFVRSELSEREDIVARLMLEARAVARMRSEHVARVLDVGRLESGGPYIVMEYLQGKDLWTILHEKGRIARPLAVDYAVQACEALAEAHALGIVHRDIKPENLFLTECPDGAAIVKLLDFGISKQNNLRNAGGITGDSTAVGSPHYMAPEQMRAETNIDGRADIWAIGVILYELLSGISPFDAESMPKICLKVVEEHPSRLAEIDDEIPRPLDAVIFRCLEKDRARRPVDVAELAAALAPYGTEETPQRSERIDRIVGGGAARISASRAVCCSTPKTGVDNTGSNAPTSLMPVAGSLLELCSKQPQRSRRATRPVALVAGAALCAGIAAGVFFVARLPLPATPVVSPAAAGIGPVATQAPSTSEPRVLARAETPLGSPAPAVSPPSVSATIPPSTARKPRYSAAGDADSRSSATPERASLARFVTKAAALNRSKASATMVSEGVGSDLAKHDATAAEANAAKPATLESSPRPNAWDPKNFGGRR